MMRLIVGFGALIAVVAAHGEGDAVKDVLVKYRDQKLEEVRESEKELAVHNQESVDTTSAIELQIAKFSKQAKTEADAKSSADSSIDGYQTEIDETKATLAAHAKEMKAAASKNKQRLATFLSKENNVATTITALDNAVKKVSAAATDGSFLTLPSKVSALLALAGDYNPQTTESRKNKSGGVLHTLETLQEEFTERKVNLVQAETRRKTASLLFQQDLQNQLDQEEENLADSEKLLLNERKKSADADKGQAVNDAEVVRAKKRLQDHTLNSKEKKDTLTDLIDRGHNFIGAVNAALPDLDPQTADALLQKTRPTKLIQEAQYSPQDIEMKVAQMLTKDGNKYHNRAISNLAVAAARGDDMGKLVPMLEKLIVKLEHDQSIQTDHAEWCKGQKAEIDAELPKAESNLEMSEAEAQNAESQLVELKTELKYVKAEIAEVEGEKRSAKKEHDATRGTMNKSIGSAENTQANLEGAKSAFLGKLNQDGADSGIKAIQKILEDMYTKVSGDLAEMRSSKDGEVARWQKEDSTLQEDLAKENETKGNKEGDIKEKNTFLDSENQQIVTHKKSVANFQNQLHLYEQDCEGKKNVLAEQLAARKAEIESLNEALTILRGAPGL